jgi:anaerobic selenocysteine-containing dehydrogenase
LCVKGKAAPEISAHPDRLRHPLRRTAPKGAADPGWERIGWDEALDDVADRLRRLAADHGPESVVFSSVSPSTSAIVDSIDWIQRLQRAFGSPNLVASMELCGWGRYLASLYTSAHRCRASSCPTSTGPGASCSGATTRWCPASPMPPRRGRRCAAGRSWSSSTRAGPGSPTRPTPGCGCVPAPTPPGLAITNVMIGRGWYDEPFVRRWTSGPLLVRSDTGRLLRAADLDPDGDPSHYVAWDEVRRPVVVDPAARGTDVATTTGWR